MQVALFGGSFDPPHIAHVLAAAYVLSVHRVDRVLVVPVFSHAFDKPLTPFEHRLAMCRLAVRPLSNVEVSDIECALGAPSRTLRTVRHLASEHQDWVLRLVVGSDVLAETHKWHAFADLVREAPLIVLGRDGYPRADAPLPVLPAVSSTRVRDLLHCSSDPGVTPELSAVLPSAVRDYIQEHRLYR